MKAPDALKEPILWMQVRYSIRHLSPPVTPPSASAFVSFFLSPLDMSIQICLRARHFQRLRPRPSFVFVLVISNSCGLSRSLHRSQSRKKNTLKSGASTSNGCSNAVENLTHKYSKQSHSVGLPHTPVWFALMITSVFRGPWRVSYTCG